RSFCRHSKVTSFLTNTMISFHIALLEWIHIHVVPGKCKFVGRLIQYFTGWLTCPMTCIGFNSNDNGIAAFMSLLQMCSKLKTVSWDYPIIMICRSDHSGGI